MRSHLAAVLLAVGLGALTAEAAPEPDLAQELAGLEARLQEISRQSLESRFERPGGPTFRLYDIADLTVQMTDFVRPNMLVRPAGSEFSEESPQFGAAREGPTFFTPDELADLLQRNVRPTVWEGGSSLDVQGQVLLVSAPADVQEDVRAALDALRADLGRIVTVEVRVLSADLSGLPAGPLGADEADALLARLARGEGGEVVASAEVTGYAGQRMFAFDGLQRAFLQDWDVEVAEEAKIGDPIVGIANEGLAFDVRALLQGDAGLLLDLRADYTDPSRAPRAAVTSVGPVQLPDAACARARAAVSVADGGALVVSGTDRHGSAGAKVAFLVRARTSALRPEGPGGETADQAAALARRVASVRRLIAAYEAAAKESGPLFRMRLYPVEDLTFSVQDEPGPSIGLVPSGAGGFGEAYAEEEAPGFFEMDQLVELVRSHVVPGSWDELLSTSLDSTEKNLVVVHTAGAHARIAEFLRELRDRTSRQVAVDVEVVSLTDADRQALAAGGPVLSDEALATLRGWIVDGRARRLDAGRVLARNHQRVALVDLRPHAYVYDYDVEIARAASIGDPLVNVFHEGLVVDVRPIVAGRGTHVVLECRMSRSVLPAGPLPTIDTTLGTIELPLIRLARLGCTLATPVGRTVIVGGGLGAKQGEDRPLLLLTPRIQ